VKTITERAVAKTAYGKALPQHIEYEFSWPVFESSEEFIATKDAAMTVDEQRKFRDTEAKAASRQSELSKALDKAGIIRPTTENDPSLRLRKMYSLFIDNGLSHADARVAASNALGIEWED
jgi:hypothetical protein